jgi:hypothetical protein
LCRWFGRLAMPIGEALSAVAGAMVSCLDYCSKRIKRMRVSKIDCQNSSEDNWEGISREEEA